MRAEVAGLRHLDIGQLGADIVRHRAFRDHHQPLRALVAHPFDHVRGRAGEVGFGQHIRRAFRMRDDLHGGIGFAIGAQLVAGKALMHLAGAFPGDDLHAGFRSDVARQILVRQEDHGGCAQALDHLDGIGRGAADIDLRLHVGRRVDIGHHRHAGKTLAQQPHVVAGDAGSQRTAGARIRDQHRLRRIEDL